MSIRHLFVVMAISGFTLCVASQAHAWCRTTTCDQLHPPASCGPPDLDPTHCNTQGTPIAWPSTCVSTSVSAHGSTKLGISASQLREVVEQAFNQWTMADCGGGKHPNFVVDIFPDVNCTDVTGDAGYKTTGPNYNVWVFDDADWPFGISGENAIAVTSTQFNPDTGLIYDSDVEPNSSIGITTGDTHVGYDLASVVQHESGHFLGLSHSQLRSTTMYFEVDAGDISKRVITQDDIDGICHVYPPGKLDPNCDPEPRHGFSTECTLAPKGCCTVAPGRVNRTRRVPETLIVGAFVAIAVVRRKLRSSAASLAGSGTRASPKGDRR